MNTPETINIEKYANALNNLIGVDSAYMAGDKSVDAIVELIVAAKKLESRVKELTEERERCLEALSELSDNIGLLKDKAKADTVRKMQDRLKNYLREVADGDIGYGWIDTIAKEMLEEEL
ncbi:MAG: hypothetical protein UH850_14930 [Paludibacteraceae bacterium]|nr:hypothetical protein [Paludibacteraceae bacterium]